MRKALICTAVLLMTALVVSAAFALPANNGVRPQKELLPADLNRVPVAGMAKTAVTDTFWFGGTVWDAGQSRWEAAMSQNVYSNGWTFDTQTPTYLQAWTDRDLTAITPPTLPPGNPDNSDFRWVDAAKYALYGTPGTDLFPGTQNPLDDGALWCGKFEQEADDLCWVSGQGYGNVWGHNAEKTFTYTAGDITLTYRYFINAEKNFDFARIYMRKNGTQVDGPLASKAFVDHTFIAGAPNNRKVKTLTITAAQLGNPVAGDLITVVFRFSADSGWSDEDGVGFTTIYSGFCLYNFVAAGGITAADDFEAGPNGWTFVQPAGVGTFVDVTELTALPAPDTSCPCVGPILQGRVLTMYDKGASGGDYLHPDGQDAMAVSPIMDFDQYLVGDRAIKYLRVDYYASMPLNNAVYFKAWLRQYPVLCKATGTNMLLDQAPDPFITYSPNPTCANDVIFEDFSTVSSDIDYAYIELELLSLCSTSSQCTPETGGGNTTPWYDNIAFVVTGTPGAPAVASTDIRPFLQDLFADDGKLSPKSTCDLDGSGDLNFGSDASDARLEDSLYVTAGATNIEVYVWFRYSKGPGTNPTNTFFTWYPLENTWYAARCDTARNSAGAIAKSWATTYHALSGKTGDIFPDGVFTPGSHLDYYYSANYVGSGSSQFWPNVPGGDDPLAVDLLPGMHVSAGDTLWPCTLYINGDTRQPITQFSIFHKIEGALDVVLGGAGRYDRYDDCLIGSNTNASFARQVTGDNGMSELQMLGYRTIIGAWGYSETYTISDDDGTMVSFWLSTTAGGANDNRQIAYFSGDGLAVDMSSLLKPNATGLLNNYFGASLKCSPYRDANCPNGAVSDTTFCVNLIAAGGADANFTFTGMPYRARGNGCPTERRFSVLDVNAGVTTAKPNMSYSDQDGSKGTTEYASVTNDKGTVQGGNYKTVLDAVGLSRIRRPDPANTWDCELDSLSMIDRLDDVLTWGALGAGGLPIDCSAADIQLTDAGDDVAGAPKVNGLSVGPNPFNPLVKLNYAVATPGRVSLRIYDVRGALVTTLVDEVKTQGRYQAVWAGQDDAGRKMPSGVFWAKYSVGKNDITRQLVLLK